MIAALLLRLGIPQWAAKVAAALALGAAAYAGFAWHDHKVLERGVAQEAVRRDEIEAAAERATQEKLAALNKQMAKAQADLAVAVAEVRAKQQEVDHANAASAQRQAELLDGRRRLSVLTHIAAAQAAATGPAAGAGAAAVDPGRAVSVDLDGRVASDLEWLRQTRNNALDGLSGCIKAYDAVKTAADKTGAQHGTDP